MVSGDFGRGRTSRHGLVDRAYPLREQHLNKVQLMVCGENAARVCFRTRLAGHGTDVM